jgi:hypothetical protein
MSNQYVHYANKPMVNLDLCTDIDLEDSPEPRIKFYLCEDVKVCWCFSDADEAALVFAELKARFSFEITPLGLAN